MYPDGCVEIGVGFPHDRGRCTARGKPCDINARRIDGVVAHDLAGDARDQSGPPAIALLVSGARSGYSRRSSVETAICSLQDHHRSAPSRPESAQSADRGENRMQRAQPDDCAWHAGVRRDSYDPRTKRGRCDRQIPSCTNTPAE